jgi:hypothetical protein
MAELSFLVKHDPKPFITKKQAQIGNNEQLTVRRIANSCWNIRMQVLGGLGRANSLT